jgi:hypothetical protein
MRTSASNLGFDLEPAGSNERSEVNPSALEILAKIKKKTSASLPGFTF